MIIGAPSYINCYPLIYPLLTKQVPSEFEFVLARPTTINQLLERAEIDVGLVSSAFFLENIYKYKIAANFGISASQEIMSVCLFTKKVKPEIIHLPKSSATSIQLLKILCLKFWKIKPRFCLFDDEEDDDYSQFEAYLLIGDRCLLHPPVEGVAKIDLSSEWWQFTQKPFTYALFAAKDSSNFDYLDSLFKESIAWSKKNFSQIIRAAEERTKLPEERLLKYYSTINFRLDQNHFDGLKLFGDYVREEIPAHHSFTL